MLDDLDAKLFDYNAAVTKACEEDFALVGGGAVFDDGDNGAARAVRPAEHRGLRRDADRPASPALQVQPLPEPRGPVRRPVRSRPSTASAPERSQLGIRPTGSLTTTQIVRDATVEAIGIVGGKVVGYDREYNPDGEANWAPFVDRHEGQGRQGADHRRRARVPRRCSRRR